MDNQLGIFNMLDPFCLDYCNGSAWATLEEDVEAAAGPK